MPKDKLAIKLKHAVFHFEKMKVNRPDDFEFQCYFAAYLASVRSVVVYVERWLRDMGRSDSWQAINNWENNSLSIAQLDRWKVITRLRNTDIHEEPIIPDKDFYSTISILDILSIAPPFSSRPRFTIRHPKSGVECDIIKLAETGIAVARKLIDEHQSL